MKINKILLLLFFMLFLSKNIFANNFNSVQQNINSQYQQQQREMEMKNRRNLEKSSVYVNDEQTQSKENYNNIQKLKFKKIEIIYNKEIPNIYRRSLNNIIKKYEDKEIELKEITYIQHQIQKYYSDKGYFLAKVYIDLQKIENNILTFVVIEGYINDIIFKNAKNKKYSKFANALSSFSFYPFAKNSPVNIKDIDQGLEQLSRLSSFSSSLNIVSDNKDGYYDIEIINDIKNRFNLSLGLDNLGLENTGVYRTNTSISADNILMLNDNIGFTYTKNFKYNKECEDNYSYFGYINIPMGYFTFSTSFFNSNYSITPGTVTGNYKSDGSSKNYNFSIETVILRHKEHKFSLGSSLSLKETANFINGQKVDVSGRKLTIADIFLVGIYYFENSMIYSKLSYVKGLDCFDAIKNYDDNNLMPKGQFSSWSLYTQYTFSFNLPILKILSNYMANFNLQYCPDILYSSEQISIGGQTSVRGFKETNISGDSGGYVQNDLNIRLSEIFKREGFLKILLYTNLDIFVDYGYVHQISDEKSYQMAGAGAGLSYKIKYFDISGYWSRNIYNTTNLQEEKNIFYFSTNVKIYF